MVSCSIHVTSPCSETHRHRFGEDSVEKMVDWAIDHFPPTGSASILEIGSGNGTLLFGLHEAGYDEALLSGIDYSQGAVDLAKNIAEAKGASGITFTRCDFLTETPATLPNHDTGSTTAVWDLLLDKGTYDAIALGPKDDEGHSPALHYPSRVVRLLKPGSILLITCTSYNSSSNNGTWH